MANQVDASSREIRYTVVAATQATFNITFPLDALDALDVYKNGVLEDPSHYAVAAAGTSLTFGVGHVPVTNDVITIDGDTTINRKNGYALRGGISSALLNLDANRVVMIMQEIARDLGRALFLTKASGGAGISMSIPAPETNKMLIGNADATGWINGPTITDVSTVAANVGAINSVAAVAAAVALVGASIANVNTVAANIVSVNACATNIAAIIQAGTGTSLHFIPTDAAAIANGMNLSAANTVGLWANTAKVATFTNPATAVDYLQFKGAATAAIAHVSIEALGSDSAIGIDVKAKGTTTAGSQFNGGVAETTGRQRFSLNGKSALELTDTYWNPDSVYDGTYNGRLTMSSGFGTGAATTDMICGVISVESDYYGQTGKNGSTVDGLTLALGAKGPTGAIHFLNNGLMGHVSIAGPANAAGADVYAAANILWMKGSQQGNSETPVIFTNGEANVGLKFYTGAGSGKITFLGNNTAASLLDLRAISTATIQGFYMSAAATGAAPLLGVDAFNGYTAGDANIGMGHTTKGTGAHAFYTNAAAQQQFGITHTASAVNYLNVTGAATGLQPTLSALGTDGNIGIIVKSKGTGNITFQTQSATDFQIGGQASAVNYLSVSGSATGTDPSLSAQGSDSTVGFKLYTAGTGNFTFQTQNTSATHLKILHTANAVDYLTITGGATGAPGTVTLAVDGSDGNVSLAVNSKGSGVVKVNGLTLTASTGTFTLTNAKTLSVSNTLTFTGTDSSSVAFGGGGTVAYTANNLSVFASTTSSQLAGIMSDETGSGALVFATSPALVTPTLGDASASSLAITGSTIPAIGVYTSAANTLDLAARSLRVLELTNPASAVNYFTMTGSATGVAIGLAAAGTDGNITISYAAKGTGLHTFVVNAATQAQIDGSASAVNYMRIAGNTTGNFPSISAQGSDAAVGLNIYTAGTGNINFYTDNKAVQALQLTRTASGVNWLNITPGATGVGPTIAAVGETNVNLTVQTKGTGSLIFQTPTTTALTINSSQMVYIGTAALATTATTGMFWISSSAGAPTGAATAPYTNAAALHYDSTNNFLYIRCGGTWRKSTVYA